ncbi:minor tail protein [Mycobacterium phage JacoRen57]|nr:minor tail protein [Mycobacterium phage JacoRen57]
MAPANLGDLVPLGQALMNFTWWGYVTDIDTPTGVWATMEAVGDEAFVTMDVLQGPRGFPGQNAPLVEVLWDPDIEEVADLEKYSDWGWEDRNKGFWIGDLVYIWDGAGNWVPKRPGPAGPRGLTPIISIEHHPDGILSWEDQLLGIEPKVEIAGTPENPHIYLQTIQGEPGPPGPSGPIRLAADYMEPEDGPADGASLRYNKPEEKWEATDPKLFAPRFFTVPEGAFTNFSGLATRQQICAFQIPPMPFDYVIKVGGHIRAVGLEADSDPLIIGAEVRLGNPTSGQLIGRGFGNISTWTTFTPHFSTPSSMMDAVTPDGTVGVVPKNTVGAGSTVYVNLYNDGLFGIYNFNKAGAQLDLLLIPVGD